VTREKASAALRDLAAGLPADGAGEARFLERVAAHADAELLRALLVEAGARAMLGSEK